jgi:DNA-binding beta-propeller fold protein YncE
VFYVLNSNAGQAGIAGYSIVSGTLTALTGSPYSLPAGPRAIAVAPNNSFLYVSTQSGIYLYTIGAGGALKLASTTPIFPDFSAYSIQVDATDSWLVEASGSGYLYAIPISPSTGLTTGAAQQISLAGIAPRQLTISPDNTNIIVALGGSGTETIPFAASSANPLPAFVGAPIAVKSAGGAAISVAVDPANQLLLIGETSGVSGTNNGVLRAFLYSSLNATNAGFHTAHSVGRLRLCGQRNGQQQLHWQHRGIRLDSGRNRLFADAAQQHGFNRRLPGGPCGGLDRNGGSAGELRRQP